MFDFLDGPVRDAVTQVYDAVGYLGVALWVAIESIVIPIPSELVLPFAGFLVGEGRSIEPLTGLPWSLPLVTLAGTIGATIGALIAYAIGFYGGRPVFERWGRYIGVTPADVDRTEAFFAKHGQAASFWGRMLPVVRSLVSFGAGVGRMPLLPFVVFTALGSLPWTLLLAFVGMQLGANWEVIGDWLSRFEYLIAAIVAIVVVAFIWIRLVRPRRARRATPPAR
ncbi:MAG TPA: DedA family protein [Candidatus Limnocylindrales bacterium]|nr:DedA family protein [Candidatus Limnocylindrales bacterium]